MLIADADQAAPQVLEVGWSDKALVWSYGGAFGTGPEQLEGPTDVEREADGSTLIADAQADRVIRVTGSTLWWQYGVSGASGSAAGYLDDPMGASLEPNGNTIIADTGNGRTIVVRSGDYAGAAGTHGFTAGSVAWRSPAAALAQPRLAERVTGHAGPSPTSDLVDGALLVCDRSGQHLALVGRSLGARVLSRTVHLTTDGSQAHLLTLRVDGSAPRPTTLTVHYMLSDGIDRVAGGPGTHSLRGEVTSTITFDFVLSAGTRRVDRGLAPSLNDVVLTYSTGQTKAKSSGNGGATGGSGTASGSGTGTGTGVGGSGSGSGVGAGQGTSTDLGGSGTAASSGSSANAGGATLTVPGTPPPVASSAGGAVAGTVIGLPVNIGELSGGARGGGGGSPPPRSSRTAARLWSAAAAALLACLLGVPPMLVHRRMRRLGAVEHADELGSWA